MINSTNDCQLTTTKKTLVGSYKNDDKNHHQTHMLNISPLNRFPPISTTYLSMEKLLMTDNWLIISDTMVDHFIYIHFVSRLID